MNLGHSWRTEKHAVQQPFKGPNFVPSRVRFRCADGSEGSALKMLKHVLFSPDVYNNVDIILFYDE